MADQDLSQCSPTLATKTEVQRRVTPGVANNKHKLIFAAMLSIYLLLAVWYTVAIPSWEATDEVAHFTYAIFLRDQRRIPVQSHDPAKLDVFMAHHPPLYYGVLALVGAGIDTSDFSQAFRPNPAYTWGVFTSGGHFVAMHDPAKESFPFNGTLLALHLFRLVSVIAGMITIFATWRITRELMGGDHWLAIANAAAVAFLPSFLFTSASVHNDNFVIMFGVLATWQALRIVRSRASILQHVLLGALIGAAALSKLSGLAFLILPVLIVLAVALKTRRITAALPGLVATLLAFLIVAGWWFVRNQGLYGDPLGWSVFASNAIHPIRTEAPALAVLLEELRPPHNLLFRSFILAFGYVDHYGPPIIYDAALLVALLGGAGLVLAIIRGWEDTKALLRSPKIWIATSLAILITGSVVRYMVAFNGGGHGRYLFPALPLITLPILLGLSRLLPGRLSPLLPTSVCVALLGLSVAFHPFIVAPEYAVAGKVSAENLPSKPITDFEGTIQLLDATVEPSSVQPGATLTARLWWRAQAKMDKHYIVFVQVLNSRSEVISQYDGAPAAGRAPTWLWNPGETFAESVNLTLPANLPIGIYRVETGFYQRPSLARLAPGTGAPSRSVSIGTVKVLRKSVDHLPGARPVNTTFGGVIRLIEASMPLPLRPGQPFPVKLLWRAESAPDKNYTLSLQLIDPQGKLASQQDSQPLSGSFPTSTWSAGDVIADEILLPIPPSMTAGVYRVVAVLYDGSNGQRLNTSSSDFAEVAQLDVVSQP